MFGLNRTQALAAWDYRGRLSVANIERDSFASLRGRPYRPDPELMRRVGALPARLQRQLLPLQGGPAPAPPPGVIGDMPATALKLRCSVCTKDFTLLREVAHRRLASQEIICSSECYAELQRRRLLADHPLRQAESKARSAAALGRRAAARTHCANGHPINEETTEWIGSRRRCRVCGRDARVRERVRAHAALLASSRPVLAADDPERIRRLLEAGFCPWCDQGPFTSPLGHVALMHGIGKREARDLALVTGRHRFVPEDLSTHLAAVARGRDHTVMWAGTQRWRADPNTKRTMSLAGSAVQREGGRRRAPTLVAYAKRKVALRETRTCQQCGKPFSVLPSRPQRFCSNACVGAFNTGRTGRGCSAATREKIGAAARVRAALRPQRKPLCAVCNRPTCRTPGGRWARTCSDDCASELRRRGLRARMVAMHGDGWEPGYRAARRRRGEQRRADQARRDETILALLEHPEVAIHDIAAQVGCSTATVTAVAKLHGRWRDGRRRFPDRNRAALERGRQSLSAVSGVARDQLLAAYRGGTPLTSLAAERNVSVKYLAGRLRRLGESVPDGRGLRPRDMVDHLCPLCGEGFQRYAKDRNQRVVKSTEGPWCSNRCAALWRAGHRPHECHCGKDHLVAS